MIHFIQLSYIINQILTSDQSENVEIAQWFRYSTFTHLSRFWSLVDIFFACKSGSFPYVYWRFSPR